MEAKFKIGQEAFYVEEIFMDVGPRTYESDFRIVKGTIKEVLYRPDDGFSYLLRIIRSYEYPFGVIEEDCITTVDKERLFTNKREAMALAIKLKKEAKEIVL